MGQDGFTFDLCTLKPTQVEREDELADDWTHGYPWQQVKETTLDIAKEKQDMAMSVFFLICHAHYE